MESWMISLVIALVGVISTFAVTKSKVDNNDKQIEALFKMNKAIGDKVDVHGESLSEHKVMIKSSLTTSEADVKYVAKEMFMQMFRQMEKHTDDKFDTLENGIEKILIKLEKV